MKILEQNRHHFQLTDLSRINVVFSVVQYSTTFSVLLHCFSFLYLYQNKKKSVELGPQGVQSLVSIHAFDSQLIWIFEKMHWLRNLNECVNSKILAKTTKIVFQSRVIIL